MTVYALKPRFQNLLRPLVAPLPRIGVTANLVTIVAALGSIAAGAVTAWLANSRTVFLIIPFWLLARMALNAIDGMLAREFHQKSVLGGYLNEIGDVVSDGTAFPYRDRKLLLQFQAWWSDPEDESTDRYIDWIRGLRTTLASQGLTYGGFFNFQDASIVPETDRHALMKYYYGHNLDKLIDVKIQQDPTNVFQSGMSIPNKR